jgi:hypothetical protein
MSENSNDTVPDGNPLTELLNSYNAPPRHIRVSVSWLASGTRRVRTSTRGCGSAHWAQLTSGRLVIN